MVNRQKIITMTKLALYDKGEGESDRLDNGYFRHDYLYRKNLATRLSVGLGGFILIGLYWLHLFFVQGADIFSADLQRQLYDSGLFLLALLALYSLIGTIQGTRQYYLAQKRINRYLALLRHLERIDAKARKTEAREAGENDILVYKDPRNS